MTTESIEQLLGEIRKLRETGEALIERVEDVAASIRHLTNNLLQEQHSDDTREGVRELADQAGELVSLSLHATGHDSVAKYAERVAEISRKAGDAEPACPLPKEEESLPTSVAERLDLLVGTLQVEAKQLKGCQQLGEETAWQWWENRFETVAAAIEQIEELRGKAASAGVDLAPYIDRRGGVPSALTRECWPDEMVRALQEHQAAERATPESPRDDVGAEKRSDNPGDRQRRLLS